MSVELACDDEGRASDLQLQARAFIEGVGPHHNLEAGFQAFLDGSGQAVFCVSMLRNPLNLDRPTLAVALLRRYLEGARFLGAEEDRRLDLLERFANAFGPDVRPAWVN